MRRLSIAAALLFASSAHAVDVPTQRGDNARSGVNIVEKALNHKSVKARFGKLWILFSDSKIMAQPLYVSNLAVNPQDAISQKAKTKCKTGCNAVIFATMKGTMYAYLADEKPTTENDTLIWAHFLGPARNFDKLFDMWYADNPTTGILGTPTIDLANKLIYVAAWNQDQSYGLYALDATSGKTKKGPVQIQGSLNGLPFFQNGSQVRKQRAGLLLDRGLLYVAFGGDSGGQSGWLFVYDAATLALKTVWSPIPGGPDGGIWMSGQGLLADRDGSIYLQTANGGFNSSANKFGNALLKASFIGSQFRVNDYFAPCNMAFLNTKDMDQGSAGPVLLPGNLVASGGKFGAIYLMARNALGKFHPGGTGCKEGAEVLQRVAATSGHIHGTPVFWEGPGNNAWLYVMGEGDKLKAFPFRNSRLLDGAADVKVSVYKPGRPTMNKCGGGLPDNWMPGGILTVSSEGAKSGTGIVWAMVPANGDSNSFRGVKGMLMAFNAENVGEELWRSQAADPNIDTANSLGLLARFAPVTVANGKVFAGNAGDKEPLASYCGTNLPDTSPLQYGLVVYGLK